VSLSFDAGGHGNIEVMDRGPGIPENELPLVFDPFYRSPKTAAVKGSGIGLSLVNTILKLHHVDLKVNSIPGQGTTFTLHFPLANQRAPLNK